MVTTIQVTSIGVAVDVHLEGLELADIDAFTQSWRRCDPREPLVPGVVSVTARLGGAVAGETNVVAAATLAELMDRLTARITICAIEVRRHDLLMFHAGAVCDPATGHAVAFIGPSGRGKTTASSVLGRSFSYVSDETVGVSDSLTIVPYPKPLSMKQALPEVWKRQVSPDDLGLGELPTIDIRLVGLVLLDRSESHPLDAPPLVSSVSLADAITELIPQVSYLPERPAALHRLRDIIRACGGLTRVTYREASTLPPVFAELLTRSPGRATMQDPAPESTVLPAEGSLVHASVQDSIIDGDAVIVLSQGTVRVLDGIAPAIWQATGHPVSRSEIVDAVVRAHGYPDGADPTELVGAALDELLAAGLLVEGVSA